MVIIPLLRFISELIIIINAWPLLGSFIRPGGEVLKMKDTVWGLSGAGSNTSQTLIKLGSPLLSPSPLVPRDAGPPDSTPFQVGVSRWHPLSPALLGERKRSLGEGGAREGRGVESHSPDSHMRDAGKNVKQKAEMQEPCLQLKLQPHPRGCPISTSPQNL